MERPLRTRFARVDIPHLSRLNEPKQRRLQLSREPSRLLEDIGEAVETNPTFAARSREMR
jgi:hypothetical protein